MRRRNHLPFKGIIGLLIAVAACSSFTEEVDPITPSPEGGAPDGPAREGGSGEAEAAAAASPYRAAVLADAPLAYWRMGISKGVTVPDETGNENALFLQGSGFTLGAPGATGSDGDTAITFDGRAGNAIAERPRVFDFPGRAPFTLECWARYEALAGGATYPALFSAAEGVSASANGYLLYFVAEVANSPSRSAGSFAMSMFALFSVARIDGSIVSPSGRVVDGATGPSGSVGSPSPPVPGSVGDVLVALPPGTPASLPLHAAAPAASATARTREERDMVMTGTG